MEVHKSAPIPVLNVGNAYIVRCLLVDHSNSFFCGEKTGVCDDDEVAALVESLVVTGDVFIAIVGGGVDRVCDGGIITGEEGGLITGGLGWG